MRRPAEKVPALLYRWRADWGVRSDRAVPSSGDGVRAVRPPADDPGECRSRRVAPVRLQPLTLAQADFRAVPGHGNRGGRQARTNGFGHWRCMAWTDRAAGCG